MRIVSRCVIRAQRDYGRLASEIRDLNDLDIQDYTDPEHNPTVPHTFVLKRRLNVAIDSPLIRAITTPNAGVLPHCLHELWLQLGNDGIFDCDRGLETLPSSAAPTGLCDQLSLSECHFPIRFVSHALPNAEYRKAISRDSL